MTMDVHARRLEGKIAFVTGAARGIGRAIAMRLAAEGAQVAVTDIDEDGAARTAQEISQQARSKAVSIRLDVTQLNDALDAVAKTERELGPIDILVNNAGWDIVEPFVESDPKTWEKVIAINYRGVLNCCKAVIPGMRQRSRGKIISISSDAGRVGSTGEAVYAGCKGAVIAFSKTLARELARDNINVNVVCPGPTETALLQNAMVGREKLFEAMKRSIPMRRFAQPHEIAGAVAFFASPDSDYVTGQVLSVSGGLTMVG